MSEAAGYYTKKLSGQRPVAPENSFKELVLPVNFPCCFLSLSPDDRDEFPGPSPRSRSARGARGFEKHEESRVWALGESGSVLSRVQE